MNKRFSPKNNPDLKLSDLQLWVLGRQYPNAQDYWDANWLNTIIHCGSSHSDVWVSGPILRIDELHKLKKLIQKLIHNSEKGLLFQPTEPNLSISFKIEKNTVEIKVIISPDQISELHQYSFRLEKENLNFILDEVDLILEKYPILGSPNKIKT